MYLFYKLFGKKIYSKTHLYNLMKETDIFKDISKDELRFLITYFEFEIYKKGEIVINQGEKPDYLGVIQEGRFNVYFAPDDSNIAKKVGSIKNGELYGEISFFNNSTATATVKAVKTTVVWEISYDEFGKFLENNIEVYNIIKNIVKNRIESNAEKLND